MERDTQELRASFIPVEDIRVLSNSELFFHINVFLSELFSRWDSELTILLNLSILSSPTRGHAFGSEP